MAPPPAPPAVLAGAAPNTLVCEALLPEVLEESFFGRTSGAKKICLLSSAPRSCGALPNGLILVPGGTTLLSN